MNPQYFERYSGYITAPFTATIVGIAVFLTAVAVIITAIRLFGNKSKALYAVNKTFSIIGLVTSILLTLAYLVIISLVALSAELFAYNGAGFIGATRDLACGIFLAPAKFGVAINSNRISTSIPFIFFTITVFSPAVLGYIAYIVSCIAQRSSVKARKSALQTEQTKAPAPIDNAETQPVPVTVAVATEEATIEQVEEAPIEQVEEAPIEQAEEAPIEQAEEAPIEQAEEAPVEQVEEAPVQQTQPVSNEGPRFCINCGTALNGGAFCINCGTPAKRKTIKTCKNCNNELADDARFCRVCGTKVE